MRLLEKAEYRSALSVISYFLCIFLGLSLGLGLLLSLGRFSLAYIKSLSYGLDISQVLLIDLFIAPYLAPLLLVYVFALSLLIVLYRLRKNGFLHSYLCGLCKVHFLTIIALGFSFLLCLLLYLFPRDILKNMQRYAALEFERGYYLQHGAFLEPGSFYHFKEWTLYLPDIAKNEAESRHFGRVYRRKGGRLKFAGTAYIRQLENGSLKLEDIQGYSPAGSGRLLRKAKLPASFPRIIQFGFTKKEDLQKTLAKWRAASAAPALPFTNRGQRTGYRYSKQLRFLQFMQGVILRFAPLFMLCYVMLFLLCLRRNYWEGSLNYLLPLLFLWFLILLEFPLLTEVEYKQPLSFAYLYFIPLSGALFLFIVRYYHRMPAFWKILFHRENTPKHLFKADFAFLERLGTGSSFFLIPLKVKKYLSKALAIRDKFQMAKLRAWLLLMAKLCKIYITVCLLLFVLMLCLRIFLHWQLNQGIDRLSWYLYSQLLDLPELLFSQFPFLVLLLLPFTLYYSHKGNLLCAFGLIGKAPKPLLLCIIGFALFFCMLSFALREGYAYAWKAKGEEIYRQNVLYKGNFYVQKYSESQKVLSYSKFLRLSKNTVLYYSQLKKIQDKYIMKGLWIDDGESSTYLFAKEASLESSALGIGGAYIHKINSKSISPVEQIKTEYQDKLLWPLPRHSNLQQSISTPVSKLPEQDTLSLYRAMAAAKELSDNSVNYIRALFWLRVLPFLLAFCICILYLSIGPLAHIETLAKVLKLAFIGFAFSFAFLYTFLYFVIY